MTPISSARPTSAVSGMASRIAQTNDPVQRQGGAEEGANHVQRAVRQVDEVHDAEHQRQAGRQQEQQYAELQPVQELNEKQCAHCPNIPSLDFKPTITLIPTLKSTGLMTHPT